MYSTEIYDEEWDAAVISEERLYKKTALSLGALLDNDMLQAAYNIKSVTPSFQLSNHMNEL